MPHAEGAGHRLLFFVSEDWYFVSHRLPLAVAAKNAGYAVTVLTRVRAHGETIRAAGLDLVPFELDRSGMNPLRELGTLLRLIAAYRRLAPTLVHQVAMKPVLYGSLAALFAGRPRVVNALAGMGWLFTGAARGGVRAWVARALGALLGRGMAIVQNPDDAALLGALGVPEGRIRRIPGAGVDLDRFRPCPEPPGPVTVVLPARLLWDKGVGEFVAAARLLRDRGVAARFVLAGRPDPANPASVSPKDVQAWVDEGVVEALGWVDDMAALWAQSHIACLPSYREGMPKALLEAAACGRPIVTTDAIGCREVVRDGVEGLLVPVRDVGRLADALQRLIEDPALRVRLGAAARARAEGEFGLDAVIRATLAVYREALA